MVVQVRNATPADAPAIAVVQVRSWRVAYRHLLPARILSALSTSDRERFWTDTLLRPMSRAGVLVATDDARVVGFAAVGPSQDSATDPETTSGELYALYLDPVVWRRGIGSHLHQVALDRLRFNRFNRAGLWVLEGNDRALALYLRHGWIETERRRVEEGPGGVRLDERRLDRRLDDPLPA